LHKTLFFLALKDVATAENRVTRYQEWLKTLPSQSPDYAHFKDGIRRVQKIIDERQGSG
jgi:hypothetical protein